MTNETPPARLKRLRMRSWRRGTREMDLILGPFADAELDKMDLAALGHFDALLDENDQDLYLWVSGQRAMPDAYTGLVSQIMASMAGR